MADVIYRASIYHVAAGRAATGSFPERWSKVCSGTDFTAAFRRPDSAALGTFMTVALTLVVTIGSVSIDMLFAIAQGLALGAIFGLVFVWIAHALLPDLTVGPATPANVPAPPRPELRDSRRKALRAMLITFPLTLLFLLSNASPSYTAVMIKVAAMGQQASIDSSREMGRSMLESTLWGGAGAVIAWQVLSIWPSLLIYTLLIALAGLLFGQRIFQGAGMHPRFSMWYFLCLPHHDRGFGTCCTG